MHLFVSAMLLATATLLLGIIHAEPDPYSRATTRKRSHARRH